MSQPAHDPDGVYLAAARAHEGGHEDARPHVLGLAKGLRFRAAVDAAVAYARMEWLDELLGPDTPPGLLPDGRCVLCGLPGEGHTREACNAKFANWKPQGILATLNRPEHDAPPPHPLELRKEPRVPDCGCPYSLGVHAGCHWDGLPIHGIPAPTTQDGGL